MSKTPAKTHAETPTRTCANPPKLSLAVQYGMAAPELPRWRLRRWVEGAVAQADPQAIQGLARIGLTLRLVDKDEGFYLNQTYRQKAYATNVLTFEYEPMPGQSDERMGDIVICVPVLQDEARAQQKPFLHHAAHLVVHGTLHALGYDHLSPEQAEQMEALEAHVLARWGIADPYRA